MKRLFILLAFVFLSAFFGEQAYAQFSFHVGYAPERLVEKDNLGEVNMAKYAGFYGSAMYSFGHVVSFTVGAQARYNKRIDGNASAFKSTIPDAQISLEMPLTIKLNYFFYNSNGFFLKTYPFVGVMPCYKLDRGIASDHKPYDVNLLGGLYLGYSHYNAYFGYRGGLFDIDNNDATKTSTHGWFFGLAFSL